ncbi:MAG: M14 family zinc carboxypeptidase, partial [Terriglobales bacterium]
MRPFLASFALAAAASLAALPGCAQAPAANPRVPAPASVLGHTPGDDFYLASYDDSLAYYRKLAASSDRIKLVNVGKTTRGLDFYLALISAPENLAALDHFKDVNRRLTWARGLDDNAAHALARAGKVFVHVDGGMHSTEVAGAQQSITLAYKLVSSQNDPEVDAILHNVILVLWPTLNPDGQNEVVAWYRKNVGTRFEVSPLPDLYQEYVGHDNNRDGYMNNMLESQEITKQELDWNPEIFYTHHQTAPFPARIFIPPFVEPISSNIQPLMMRWLNALGVDMAAYLDEHNLPGAISRVGFDNWYPGFQDFTGIFRNSIAFFTETALYGYATPHFYTVRDFPPNYRSLTSGVFYSSPWDGGWWRLGDAVRYMQAASMSVLDTAAKYHEQLLYNKYQAGRDNIKEFTDNPPYAYIIPGNQDHRSEAANLARVFVTNGLEVQQATAPIAANGRSYAAGSWVILMDQPFAGLAKELMEPQDYPSILQNGNPVRPYDVAGWTLPLQMGVEADAVLQPLTAAQRNGLKLLTTWTEPAGAVQGSGGVYLFAPDTNQHFAAINQL